MKKMILAALVMAASAMNVNAGGLLTNTNQSINFLRNPARDGAIGIDGVYSNPAGVAFMNEGFHLGLNWQAAWQTRTIDTTNPNYLLGVDNTSATKQYKGKAQVPFLPSLQAAYNWNKWSFQFNFAVHGGGGRCEFQDGLGSFENAVANIASSLVGQTGQIATGFTGLQQQMAAAGVNGIQTISPVTGYSFEQYMQGKQYYFGFTLGAAYKINEHLSVYGGARILYGTANYKAKLENIQVQNAAGDLMGLKPYFGGVAGVVQGNGNVLSQTGAAIQSGIQQTVGAMVAGGMSQEDAMNSEAVQTLVAKGNAVAAAGQAVQGVGLSLQEKTALLDQYADGVNLQSDQSAFGIAPIIGVDYRIGNFNFAGKYEFRAKMAMKNKSTVDKVSAVAAVNKFLDGSSVREDSPAMLSLGAQWDAMPNLHINAGYHHFYDCDSKKYNDEQKLLSGGTNEYLGGVEYDINNKFSASAGVQVTRYGLTDAFMNDMSFVCNSWSFGLGASYKVTDKIKVEVAYFQTNYEKYKTETPNANGTMNEFNRTNRVLGAGVTFDF